jgi:Holliday junction resolvase RusA-like endonuclease
MEVKFTVYGKPKGKGRPRFTQHGSPYTPQSTVDFENLVKVEYVNQCGETKLEGPMEAEILAVFPIPKSVSKKQYKDMVEKTKRYTSKPDGDNVLKGVLDSLNHISYGDDSYVTDIVVRKRYGEHPRVDVTLREVDEYELLDIIRKVKGK